MQNLRIFNDTTTIRLHVLVGDFIENYMTCTFHGEKAPPLTDNPLDEIIEDVEFDIYGGGDDDGVGVCYGDGVNEGPINGGSDDGS